MITAILSTFIVIGMAFVFIARRKLKNIQEEEDIINTPEAVDQDASRIRQELEQTADEIIQRMAVRIDRLELLIREADRKSNILQRKIEKLEKLEKVNDLPKVDNTGSESEFANLLKFPLGSVYRVTVNSRRCLPAHVDDLTRINIV